MIVWCDSPPYFILAGGGESTDEPVYMTALLIAAALVATFFGVRFVLRPAMSFIARQGCPGDLSHT